MWCLISPDGETCYNLTPGRIHTVSRKTGDIILSKDNSVSRTHAYIEVNTPVSAGVSVWDDLSKYGTFVDEGITAETRIPRNEKAVMKDGSKVRFGLVDNTWTLKRELLCVCSHMLKAAEKNKVKSVISQLGGKVVDSWTENPSYLTTSTVRLTHEIMCALASAKSIVTPQFWQSYLLMMTSKGAPADPATYVPPIVDKRMVGKESLCLPNPSRKLLFKNKRFIFPTTQSFKLFKSLVELAGGQAENIVDRHMPLDDFCEPHVLVIHCAEDERTPYFNRVMRKLTEKKLRVIPEEEIYLAIWSISLSKYCHPKNSPNDFFRKSNPEPDLGVTLVKNTEDMDASSIQTNFSNKVIPPSLPSSDSTLEDRTMSTTQLSTTQNNSALSSRKRIRDDDTDGIGKKAKTSTDSSVIKTEPEEDMFADEIPQKSAQISVSNMKRERKSECADDFVFKSPRKEKKLKQNRCGDESDLFALPDEPVQSANDDNDEDFFESSKISLMSSRKNKSNDASAQNESRDLFDASQEPSASSSITNGKRKIMDDAEEGNPPLKRTPKDITNIHPGNASTHIISSGFCSAKKEVKKDPDGSVDGELASRFCAKVVVTSLVKRQIDQNQNNAGDTTDSRLKNFKKFRKAWSGSSSRHQVTTITAKVTNGNASNEEEEDGSFLQDASPQRKNESDNYDDNGEFALPSYSQV